ncbi:MAG: helix-turn-helix domain-containing protein [Acetatifactor sp.]|nr:helix-turn-helix domain-containing protein [Acetatifactor sp.]
MTIGENIRRIRQARKMTMVKLAEEIGCDAALIRKYEVGERNPKRDRLEAIAKALDVNVEVLANSEFDGVTAMHWLFQLFNAYEGKMTSVTAEDGSEEVMISFPKLGLMKSWYEEYQQYEKNLPAIQRAFDSDEEFLDAKEKYVQVKKEFRDWMDRYPVTEGHEERLAVQKEYDAKSTARHELLDKMFPEQ